MNSCTESKSFETDSSLSPVNSPVGAFCRPEFHDWGTAVQAHTGFRVLVLWESPHRQDKHFCSENRCFEEKNRQNWETQALVRWREAVSSLSPMVDTKHTNSPAEEKTENGTFVWYSVCLQLVPLVGGQTGNRNQPESGKKPFLCPQNLTTRSGPEVKQRLLFCRLWADLPAVTDPVRQLQFPELPPEIRPQPKLQVGLQARTGWVWYYKTICKVLTSLPVDERNFSPEAWAQKNRQLKLSFSEESLVES